MATGSIFEQIIDPANRADPWSLYRELRKTPVTREADGTYVVSRYRDIVALLHDPRVSATGGVARRDDAFAEMDQYFAALAAARREAPGEDLLSALVADDRTWTEVSREELLANVALLLFAGHETTADLIANGILTLLRHPGALKRVGSEPGFAVLAVEEVLRYEPVLHFLPNRLALDDIDVAGVTIPAGAPIRPALAAGNRDPDYVRDPDRFDPDRHNPECADVRPEESQHLSFGAGIHYCFGAPLARLETEIALTGLARRLENPRLLADPPPYRPNPLLHGPAHLPVGFDRIRPARESGAPRSDVALSPDQKLARISVTGVSRPGGRRARPAPPARTGRAWPGCWRRGTARCGGR